MDNKNFVEHMAFKCAVFLYNSSGSHKYTIEEIEYGNKIFFNTLGVLLFTLLPSALLHWEIQAIVVLFAFALLRFFSGGLHIDSSLQCIIASSTLMLSIILVESHTVINFSVISFLTLTLVYIYAPCNIESHLKYSNHNLFRIISITIVFLNIFVLKSDLICLTFFMQSLTLIGRYKK